MADGKMPRGRPFQPGNSGRPKGSRNKLAEDFLRVLYDDFRVHGAAAVVAMREEKPAEYVKVVASLMPQKVEVERAPAEMTDAELLAILQEGRRAEVAEDAGPLH